MKSPVRVGIVLCILVLCAGFLNAEVKFGVALAMESGGKSAAPPALGNTALQGTSLHLYAASVFRFTLDESAAGVGIFVTRIASAGSSYLAAYQPHYRAFVHNPWASGNPGISSSSPEYIFALDLSFHPRTLLDHALDLEMFFGPGLYFGGGSSSALPIATGLFMQAGAGAQYMISGFFLQARGAFRFNQLNFTADNKIKAPAPVGSLCLMMVAGVYF